MRSRGPTTPLGRALLGLALLALGLVILAVSVHQVLRQARCLLYPACTATVEGAWTVSRHGKGGVSYSPYITYEYQKLGRSWTSSRDYILTRWGTQGWAQEIVQAYPPHQRVLIYCSDSDPSDSYLFRDRSFQPYLVFLIALVLTTGGAGSLWRAVQGIGPGATWPGIVLIAAPIHALLVLMLLIQYSRMAGQLDAGGIALLCYIAIAMAVGTALWLMKRRSMTTN